MKRYLLFAFAALLLGLILLLLPTDADGCLPPYCNPGQTECLRCQSIKCSNECSEDPGSPVCHHCSDVYNCDGY